MQHYGTIYNVFKAVLNGSQTFGGRLFWAPQNGLELNTDSLSQVFSENAIEKRYPLVLLLPPRGTGSNESRKANWEELNITMFFLTTTYYDGQQVARRNPKTGTSQRPVTEDWDRMKAASADFFKALKLLHDRERLFEDTMQLPETKYFTVPVSFVGIDRVSGVRADFRARIMQPCEIRDYDIDNLPKFKNNDC